MIYYWSAPSFQTHGYYSYSGPKNSNAEPLLARLSASVPKVPPQILLYAVIYGSAYAWGVATLRWDKVQKCITGRFCKLTTINHIIYFYDLFGIDFFPELWHSLQFKLASIH